MGSPIRRRTFPDGGAAIPLSFDQDACALVVRESEPRPQYVRGDVQVFARTVTASDSAPNTVAPAVANIYDGGEQFGSAALHMVLPSGGSCGLQTWALTEVAPGTFLWLLVDTIASVVSTQEYTVPLGYRPAFFCVTGAAGIGDGVAPNPDPATLRVAGV
jgi:hypothetical protein